MLSLDDASRKVTQLSATFASVHEALASGRYDGWHFTGHGAARTGSSDRAGIFLQGEDPFTPLDLSGAAANVGLATPLVFLNACQVGRGGMSLTGIGGWARRFLDAGAGAFIGTYWSVYDTPAFDFAKEFYRALLNGRGIGQAAMEARLAIRDRGDPTWLSYTIFADPTATLA
jgi:CHAT domain-containing protein